MYAGCRCIGMSRFVFGGHRFGMCASMCALVTRSVYENPNNKYLCVFTRRCRCSRRSRRSRRCCCAIG